MTAADLFCSVDERGENVSAWLLNYFVFVVVGGGGRLDCLSKCVCAPKYPTQYDDDDLMMMMTTTSTKRTAAARQSIQ